MKTFAIRNEENYDIKDLAYLIYYEKDKRFYIEIADDVDEWDVPLVLSSFLKKGQKTINSYWSKKWVQQRIVPEDRQNLGQILKDNNLDDYDEYRLLLFGNGRCAQDSFYLAPVDASLIEEKFKDRYEQRIIDVVPLNNNNLLVFFKNGQLKKCDIASIVNKSRFFKPILNNHDLFLKVQIQTGGYGVCWGDNLEISDFALYQEGTTIPLTIDDFINFYTNRIISSNEATKILNCSRQNINELVKHGKLQPVRIEQKNTYFLKSDIVQRNWQ